MGASATRGGGPGRGCVAPATAGRRWAGSSHSALLWPVRPPPPTRHPLLRVETRNPLSPVHTAKEKIGKALFWLLRMFQKNSGEPPHLYVTGNISADSDDRII